MARVFQGWYRSHLTALGLYLDPIDFLQVCRIWGFPYLRGERNLCLTTWLDMYVSDMSAAHELHAAAGCTRRTKDLFETLASEVTILTVCCPVPEPSLGREGRNTGCSVYRSRLGQWAIAGSHE